MEDFKQNCTSIDDGKVEWLLPSFSSMDPGSGSGRVNARFLKYKHTCIPGPCGNEVGVKPQVIV